MSHLRIPTFLLALTERLIDQINFIQPWKVLQYSLEGVVSNSVYETYINAQQVPFTKRNIR